MNKFVRIVVLIILFLLPSSLYSAPWALNFSLGAGKTFTKPANSSFSLDSNKISLDAECYCFDVSKGIYLAPLFDFSYISQSNVVDRQFIGSRLSMAMGAKLVFYKVNPLLFYFDALYGIEYFPTQQASGAVIDAAVGCGARISDRLQVGIKLCLGYSSAKDDIDLLLTVSHAI